MINIIGFLILITGFCFPYLTHMRVPSTYFFWVGSLLSLNKGIIIRSRMKWAQAAQVGILINIAIAVMMALAYFSIGYGSITRLEEWIQTILYWASSPATAVGQKIFPYPETHSNGRVYFYISHSRTVITAFLNVATFALTAALFSILWQKRKSKKIRSESGKGR
jgi:hypothetical protein